MDTFSVEIQGKKEFEETLRNLVKALPNDKVEPVMMEGAKVIADAARAKAPKGPTGNLKRSVKSKFLKQISNYPRSAAAAVDRKIAPHAHLIEYGTKPRIQKTTGRYTGIGPAHPFFRPAVDANRSRIYTQIRDKLLDMIMEAARK
jgi:HK97 gp10 family phage protein